MLLVRIRWGNSRNLNKKTINRRFIRNYYWNMNRKKSNLRYKEISNYKMNRNNRRNNKNFNKKKFKGRKK
jgi:hypothetical protein